MAEEQELDLVLMSPNAVPPVCKIMDYGKHRFDTLKKEKEAKKKQKVIEIKEIKLSAKIAQNDINYKIIGNHQTYCKGDVNSALGC